jgi:hypothetical protein
MAVRRLNIFKTLLAVLVIACRVWAASSGTVIDMADVSPPAKGTGWTYFNNVYTIQNGANISITKTGTGERRIEVAKNAKANIILDGVTIEPPEQSPLLLNNNANVTLTLKGTNKLAAGDYMAGIQVPETTTLTITGTGNLTAKGRHNGAGIGGSQIAQNGATVNCGTIVINSGTITATGGANSAGIGSTGIGSTITADGKGGICSITINGGTITATGQNNGAGISSNRSSSTTITVNGGKVTAIGSGSGAGIGGNGEDRGGAIIINGGIIMAIGGEGGGAGIGGGYNGAAGTFTLNGNATVFASSLSATGKDRKLISGILLIGDIGTKTIFTGTPVTVYFPANGATAVWKHLNGKSGIAYASGNNESFIEFPGITVINRKLINNIQYMDKNGITQTINGVEVIDARNISVIDNLNGWFLIRGKLTRNETLRVSGTAHIILEDGSDLIVKRSSFFGAGIDVSEGNNLTIYAQSTGNNAGKLTASSGYGGAGIGGNRGRDGGIITINGGTITATGQEEAGIGGGSNGSGGTITINGGTITANGGRVAGIGGGSNGSSGKVTINGGKVTTTTTLNYEDEEEEEDD